MAGKSTGVVKTDLGLRQGLIKKTFRFPQLQCLPQIWEEGKKMKCRWGGIVVLSKECVLVLPLHFPADKLKRSKEEKSSFHKHLPLKLRKTEGSFSVFE